MAMTYCLSASWIHDFLHLIHNVVPCGDKARMDSYEGGPSSSSKVVGISMGARVVGGLVPPAHPISDSTVAW
jgi:hypothetical protein